MYIIIVYTLQFQILYVIYQEKTFICVMILLEAQAVCSTPSALQYTVQEVTFWIMDFEQFTATYGHVTGPKDNSHKPVHHLRAHVVSYYTVYCQIQLFLKKKNKKGPTWTADDNSGFS